MPLKNLKKDQKVFVLKIGKKYQRIPEKNLNQKLPAKILYYFSYFRKLMYNIAFLYKSLHFTVAVRTGKSWAAVFQSWLCE